MEPSAFILERRGHQSVPAACRRGVPQIAAPPAPYTYTHTAWGPRAGGGAGASKRVPSIIPLRCIEKRVEEETGRLPRPQNLFQPNVTYQDHIEGALL